MGTVLIRLKATLLNNYEARGWRLKNYVEVLVSHIWRVALNRISTVLILVNL